MIIYEKRIRGTRAREQGKCGCMSFMKSLKTHIHIWNIPKVSLLITENWYADRKPKQGNFLKYLLLFKVLEALI